VQPTDEIIGGLGKASYSTFRDDYRKSASRSQKPSNISPIKAEVSRQNVLCRKNMADEKYCTGDLQTLFSNYGTVTDVSISLIEKPERSLLRHS